MLTINSTLVRSILASAGIFCLYSCQSNVSLSLNDQVVYTPPPLFSDFQVTDRRLHDCLQQTIIDQRITRSAQLRQLACRHTGITSLSGIQQFNQLETVDFRNNPLEDISALNPLTKLTTVYIDRRSASVCQQGGELEQRGVEIIGENKCE